MSKKANKPKKFEQYAQTKPMQLTLFELLGLQDRDYSNTIELYDFIPKYFWGKAQRINGKFLEALERDFQCRGQLYQVIIKPARVKGKDGIFREHFPSKREELVEDALRKFASEGSGIFLDAQAGVTFTLYQLQRELKERGHSYSKDQLKEALFILAETHLELASADNQVVIKANMFQALGLKTQEDGKGSGKKTRAFVRFHPLVTKAIESMKFRQVNYAKAMSFSSVIARQLYKRMSHHYIQASLTSEPYSILLSTIIRDFGLTQYAQLRDNFRDLVKALEEMKEKDVILEYKIEKTLNTQQRNKLVDAKFTIRTTPHFNAQMMKANQRAKDKVLPERLFPKPSLK